MAQFVEHSPDYRLGRLSFTKIFSALSILVFLSLLLISLNYKLSALVMPGYISYDVKRVSEIIILMLAVTVIGVSRKHQYYWLSQWMLLPQAARYLLFSVFVIGIISSWIAPMPRMAFMEVALYAALFVWVFFCGCTATGVEGIGGFHMGFVYFYCSVILSCNLLFLLL